MDRLTAIPSTRQSPPQAQVLDSGVRTYLARYLTQWTLPDGAPVTIRPIHPQDEPLMRDFHERVSDQSVYFRYFHMIQLSERVAHESLSRLCFADFEREIVLVAEGKDASNGRGVILAVGRLSRTHRSDEAELDILVHDAYQRHGLGTELSRRLIAIGRAERLCRITAMMLSDNRGMQRICEKLGFELSYIPEDKDVLATLNLHAA